MKCVHCGTGLRNESNFCFECGKPVNAKECYIKELTDARQILTRETDRKSLDHIIELTEKIFNRTNENPALKYESRRFFESYLPMITDVLSRYRGTQDHHGVIEHDDSVKDDLTDVLDTTEEAFEIMLKDLYEHDIMELQINIEALKSKISRDGMLKSQFTIEK